MAIVNESTGKRPEIEDGLYTFQITDTVQGIRQSDEYGHAGEPTLTLKCLIMGVLDEDGADIYLDPMLSLKYKRPGKTQASSLYLYAHAAGVAPPEGQPLDTDRLIGRVLQGKITTEGDSWPRIEPKSLMPVKKQAAQKAQEAPLEAADAPPWQDTDALAEAEALAQWFDRMDEAGIKRKDVNDASLDLYGKPPRDLTAAEREQLAKSLTA